MIDLSNFPSFQTGVFMASKCNARTFFLIFLALVAVGCASKKYVKTETATVEAKMGERMDGLESQVEANQTRITEQEAEILDVSRTAQDALDRAIAAGQLAEGRFIFETVMTDEQVRFGLNRADLSTEARAALDAFAELIRSDDANVFIEIQGHTDSQGSAMHNLELGLKRAEAVRRYLNQAHAFPLHRMSVISYGPEEPIATNDTAEGRAQNRRVALVVLK
ncbi:MAG: OmpA family protein [Acidobacteriota bacterium]